MNGKIDVKGQLWIERAGVMMSQMCPFSYSRRDEDTLLKCDHFCPLFGEPEPEQVSEGHFDHHIAICHGTTLTFSQFTDERPKP